MRSNKLLLHRARIGILGMCLFFSQSDDFIRRVAACDCRHADFVPSLPGWNQPTPSSWYSGYLTYTLPHPGLGDEDGDVEVHTHYVLVQAELDFHNSKPLLYWSNGGPGASSLFGLLTEFGPLQLSDLSLHTDAYRSTGIPSLVYNPFAWTRLGSVLVFDQPAPVGFSYCGNDTENKADKKACGAWTDERSAENAYRALQAFYDKFPCYNATELYLTGESYAGIYIPTLARRILQEREMSPLKSTSTAPERSDTPIRDVLQGFAVGDGCLGTETGVCGDLSPHHWPDVYRILFLAGHGQVPFRTFTEAVFACQAPSGPVAGEGDRRHVVAGWDPNNDECQRVLAKAKEQAGGYFEYSLYDDCIYRNLASSGRTRSGENIQGALNDYPCGGFPVMQEWLSLPEVQRALHVRGTFFSVDNAENFDYTPTEKDLTGFYRRVATDTNLRVLVYNGDTDPSITSFAAQNWTTHLGLTESQAWRPWSVDRCQRVGGYVTRYEGDLDFLTVRGAGHMVPTYKAEATFAFLKSWIEGTDYPRYNPSCTKPPPSEDEASNVEVGVGGDLAKSL